VHVVTTTISDYMNDFETFLVEFWAAKFSYTILEAVILAYIRVILFKKGVQAPVASPTTPDSPAPKMGFFSSLMRKTAEISQKMINTGEWYDRGGGVCCLFYLMFSVFKKSRFVHTE
jgi:hypothetical protein